MVQGRFYVLSLTPLAGSRRSGKKIGLDPDQGIDTQDRQNCVIMSRSMPRVTALFLIFAVLLGVGPVSAALDQADLENGKEINELSAGCHGEFGEGGKQGIYPRLAGEPYQFLVDQLVLFRERKSPNLAMVESVDDRQMPDQDIRDISACLAAIQLPTRLAPIDEISPDFDALARLQEAKRVLQIPRAEGDISAGGKL
jgi:cytochrome c553